MQQAFWLKLSFIAIGILFMLGAALSFNEGFIRSVLSYLAADSFLIEKANKYITNYRYLYFALGFIFSFVSALCLIPKCMVKLCSAGSIFDDRLENLNDILSSRFKILGHNAFSLIKRYPESLLYIGMFLSLFFTLVLSWLDVGLIVSRFVYDDIYCYLQVARNIVTGHGATFDGANLTNGFHPLWMGLSILLQLFFHSDPNLSVHLALTVAAIFHVLTAYYLYRLIFFLGFRIAGIIIGLFWAMNYNLISIALCGLETSLFGFFIAFTLYKYLAWRNDFTLGRVSIIGLLLGLTVLARFDGFLFFIFLAIDYALISKKRMANALVKLLLLSAILLLSVLPWLVWSYFTVGCLLPITWQAKSPLQDIFSGSSFLSSIIKKILLQIGWLHYSFSEYLRIIGAQSVFGKFTWLILASIILPFLHKLRLAISPIKVFMVYALAHFSYYFLLIPSLRYAYPAFIIVLAAFFLVLGQNYSLIKRRLYLVIVIMPFVIFGIINDSLYAWNNGFAGLRTHSLHSTMYYDAVAWLRNNTPNDAVIGSFNSGIYGYYSGRRVVNLDGYINNNSYYVIKDKRLFGYIKEQKISYLIDWNKYDIESRFEECGGEKDYKKHLVLLATIAQGWGPYKGKEILIYRVVYN